jgi:hypothetical protein
MPVRRYLKAAPVLYAASHARPIPRRRHGIGGVTQNNDLVLSIRPSSL